MQKIRVVIAEGRTLFRQGLAALLRAEPDFDVVGEAADADEARRVCARTLPHLVVLDAALTAEEDAGRLEVISGLRVGSPCAVVVVIGEESGGASAEVSEQTMSTERRRALQHGAAAYLWDTVDSTELLRVLRRFALSKEGQLASHALESRESCADWSGEAGDPTLSGLQEKRRVTEREGAILTLIAQGMCNKEVAHRLGISTQTVKNHVSHLLEKLNLADRTQLAVYALERHLPQ